MAELPRHKLSDSELRKALKGLRGWKVQNGKVHREYQFKDFVHAFGFMASVALVAESMSHHPEWCNVYNKVVFDLWTHSIPGISNLDIELAKKIEALAQPLASK
jgi:4a-hydroxytetrahydrobiopterin dehydratase